jgi:hypothetical protein
MSPTSCPLAANCRVPASVLVQTRRDTLKTSTNRSRRALALLGILLIALTLVAAPRPAVAASQVGGPVSRSEAIARASYWLGWVYYSQNQGDAAPDGDGHTYRPDCSGLVAMAWHLPKKSDGWDFNTGDFDKWSGKTYLGSFDDLEPGDAVLGVSYGHIALFERWADAAHNNLVVLQEYDYGKPATRMTVSRSWYLDNGFRPIRYNQIEGGGGIPGPTGPVGVLQVWGDAAGWHLGATGLQVSAGSPVSAVNMGGGWPQAFVNDGGRVVQVWGDSAGWHAGATGLQVSAGSPVSAVNMGGGWPQAFALG